MLNLDQYKAFIFDLDNTIYDEKDYLFPAYKEIAKHVQLNDKVVAKDAEQFLRESFLSKGRGKLFDEFMKRFQIRNSSIHDFLNILRTNKTEGKIKMNKNISSFIKRLIEDKKRIFVLTNGNVVQQKNKVSQIDWNGTKDQLSFVFANETEKKPSPLEILNILKSNNYNANEVLMIGDGKDDEGSAKNAGISFLHVNELLAQVTKKNQ